MINPEHPSPLRPDGTLVESDPCQVAKAYFSRIPHLMDLTIQNQGKPQLKFIAQATASTIGALNDLGLGQQAIETTKNALLDRQIDLVKPKKRTRLAQRLNTVEIWREFAQAVRELRDYPLGSAERNQRAQFILEVRQIGRHLGWEEHLNNITHWAAQKPQQ